MFNFKKNRFFEKIKYVFFIIISLFLNNNFKKKVLKKRIWLIGAGDDIYSNNCKLFYEYICSNHKEIDIYWVCEEKNKNELIKHIPQDKLIARGSVFNYLMIANSEIAVCGFSDYDVAPGYFRLIKKRKPLLVYISHGFDGLKGMPCNYYTAFPTDIICAASEYEKRIKIEKCGASEDKVVVTGYARYDVFDTYTNVSKKKRVFIMPTWRDWYEYEDTEYENTALYHAYNDLFRNLSQKADDVDFEVIYKFHPRMESFFKNADWKKYSNIKQANEDTSIQELLEKSDIIITDYSSVFWDAIYMKKNVILFWFDKEEYSEKRGLLANCDFYNYIASDISEFMLIFDKMLKNNVIDDNIRNQYFNWFDKDNCKRIFEAINLNLPRF